MVRTAQSNSPETELGETPHSKGRRSLCKRKPSELQSGCNYKSKCFSSQAICSQCHCHFLFIMPFSLQFKSFPTHDCQRLAFFG